MGPAAGGRRWRGRGRGRLHGGGRLHPHRGVAGHHLVRELRVLAGDGVAQLHLELLPHGELVHERLLLLLETASHLGHLLGSGRRRRGHARGDVPRSIIGGVRGGEPARGDRGGGPARRPGPSVSETTVNRSATRGVAAHRRAGAHRACSRRHGIDDRRGSIHDERVCSGMRDGPGAFAGPDADGQKPSRCATDSVFSRKTIRRPPRPHASLGTPMRTNENFNLGCDARDSLWRFAGARACERVGRALGCTCGRS